MRCPTVIHASMMLIAFSWSVTLRAETYFVRHSGNDQADGKTPQAAFATVGRAAQTLNHGDSIVIGPGRYACAALLAERFGTTEARVSIVGDESGRLTGDPAGEVRLDSSDANEPALRLDRVVHATISGLSFHGPGDGLKMERCSDFVVERCTFDRARRGLAVANATDIRIESSVFNRCVIGISVAGSMRTRVAHATVVGCGSAGVLISTSGEGAIRNSIFAANNTAFAADTISAGAWSSDHNALQGPVGPWGPVAATQNVYEWFAASGQDRRSIYVVPSLVNPDAGDLRIESSVTWGGGLPGEAVGAAVDPAVKADRSGAALVARDDGRVCIGAFAYPAAAGDKGWKRLDAKLAAPGVRQSAGVYRDDGTLVRSLIADATGVSAIWWDGRDDLGHVAPTGNYQLRSVAHDVRVLDDGSFGDNGSPLGCYNPDNVDRVVALPDGGFIVTAEYDEAGFTLRRFAATGQSVYASALVEGNYFGLAMSGPDVIGGIGKGKDAKVVRLTLPGDRAPMANGAADYKILTEAEGDVAPSGLALVGNDAVVALPKLNVLRVIDLATGNKKADWPINAPSAPAVDAKGNLWAASGNQLLAIDPSGKTTRTFATSLEAVHFLAAGKDRLAAVDRKNNRVALLDANDGHVIKSIGEDRTKEIWTPVLPQALRDPRGAAFLADGRLVLCEQARIRIFSPDLSQVSHDADSNFMDTAVVHPTNPRYTYCGLGVFEVDPKTGAWKWLVETPPFNRLLKPEDDPFKGKRPSSAAFGIVLGGKPFVVYFAAGDFKAYEVTDPLKPRLASSGDKALPAYSYATIAFNKAGDILLLSGQGFEFVRFPFKGLDGGGNPTWDFAAPVKFGSAADPSPRKMQNKAAVACDRATDDLYFLAVTELYNKMVPGWGADGSGLGKCSGADAKPIWFALSSGGNYMSVSAANDGKQSVIMGCKSFGGQIDLFDPDGLRLATGNWSMPNNYWIGFVDVRYGCNAYVRPDGKIGAYIEDDAVGRLSRARVDGLETIQRSTVSFAWNTPAAGDAPAATAHATASNLPRRLAELPRVGETLPLDGDWARWEKQGVSPQIVSLPCSVGFRRFVPEGLMQSFRQGTGIGAVAHDGANLYAYFVVADDTPVFSGPTPADLWKFDSIELWIEEEQFGLGFLADGSPALMKWRQHDMTGTSWKAGYALDRSNIWAKKFDDLSQHPLGRQLATITGVSFAGKPGYAVMAKIPFEEIRLVGGIAGRQDKAGNAPDPPMTGKPGELIRIAVSLNGVVTAGRYQDYQIDWPVGRMFADPTRSYPFELK